MVNIVDVATWGRLSKGRGTGENWGPCPICDAGQTSRNDKRPPLRLKPSTNQWLCVAGGSEPHGGGPVTLARALHAKGALSELHLHEVLAAEGQPVKIPEMPLEVAPGRLDVAGGWAQLQRHIGRWRGKVRAWCLDRGLGDDIASAVVDCGAVAANLDGRRPNRLGPWLAAVAWPPRDLFVVMRDANGVIVDLERRWIRGSGAPEKGPKTARLSSETVGGIEGPVMFGSIERAVTAATHGEPVILVEGSADWIAAQGACRARKLGEAIGSPSARSFEAVAKALVAALKEKHAVPGAATVHIVPHVGDLLDRPEHRDHRIGERCAWNAGVELLEIARVRWCPPHPVRGDLCDAMSGTLDPVAAFWALVENGLVVLDSGQKIIGEPGRWRAWADRAVYERWQVCSDWDLGRAAYRLPLSEFMHYHHYVETEDKSGQRVIEHRRHIPPLPNMPGEQRITQAVLRWLGEHGITFSKDGEGQWVYDPLERARPPLVAQEPPRQLPRLFKVGSPENWSGWLQELGYLNPAAGSGRLIEKSLLQLAQRAATSTLRSWLTADRGKLDAVTIRLHLHTRMEQVLVLDDRGLGTVPNGADGQVLLREERVPRVDFISGMEASAAAWLFWQLMGSAFTVQPELASMMVAHPLLAPVREHLTARPILYSTGPAGAGKSLPAKSLASWFYASPDPDDATAAAAWELSRRAPMLLFDNLETRFIEGDLEKFLLNATTRAMRQRRSLTSDRGIVGQQVSSLICINAINPPVRPEMLRRCLLVEHDRRWRRDGFSEVDHLEAIVSNRAALWTAMMRLYQDRVRPALSAGRHREWAARVPVDHPVEGMRESLGVMATIGEALAELCPMWGPFEPAWGEWLRATGHQVLDMRRQSDPLQLALDELLLQWNRTVDGYEGRRRPAIGDELFACRPLFLRSDGATLTPELKCGLENGARVAQVVAFEGTYPQLYRDLCEATRNAQAFRQAVKSPKDVGHNIGNIEGWRSEMIGRLGRGGIRVYRWTNMPAIEALRAQHCAEPEVEAGDGVASSEPRVRR